ncbi:MAG: tetratricopeptide repeat protein [Caulobacteraceae bacterium]|nr:tetratricopeptide repeat protein [Caulobacteraceae bacterium]
MFLFGGLSLLLAIALAVHVVRSGRELYWLWIILVFQPLGGLVYLFAIVLPELMGGRTARRIGRTARETLDPNRAWREAKAAYDDTPTVANGMRLAQAAAGLGRYAEAEALYREAAQGVHADDPTLLLGRANALIELGRFAEALAVLEALGQDADRGRTPQAALALGRAYEGLGRYVEADTAYEWSVERLPGLEAISRYAAFQARTGKRDAAEAALKEIDRRIARADPAFRKEGRAWRALAAEAIG